MDRAGYFQREGMTATLNYIQGNKISQRFEDYAAENLAQLVLASALWPWEILLGKGLFWHAATIAFATLSVRRTRETQRLMHWCGACSQAYLTQAMLRAPVSVPPALLAKPISLHVQKGEARYEMTGAITAARVIATLQSLGAEVYEASVEEDVSYGIDVLLLMNGFPPIALQIKSDARAPHHVVRKVCSEDGDLCERMQRGCEKLQEETGVPWLPVICKVSSNIDLLRGVIGPVNSLASIFHTFLQQMRRNPSP